MHLSRLYLTCDANHGTRRQFSRIYVFRIDAVPSSNHLIQMSKRLQRRNVAGPDRYNSTVVPGLWQGKAFHFAPVPAAGDDDMWKDNAFRHRGRYRFQTEIRTLLLRFMIALCKQRECDKTHGT